MRVDGVSSSDVLRGDHQARFLDTDTEEGRGRTRVSDAWMRNVRDSSADVLHRRLIERVFLQIVLAEIA